jgi:hypothetical protein
MTIYSGKIHRNESEHDSTNKQHGEWTRCRGILFKHCEKEDYGHFV